MQYVKQLQGKIKGFNNRLLQTDSHIQIGKTYLYRGYEQIAPLIKTNGGETANRRIDMGILKSHSNDAVVITGLFILPKDLDVVEYKVKPQRRKRLYKAENTGGKFKHGDIVYYTNKKGEVGVYKIQAILLSGTHKGKYKLQEINSKKRVGPIGENSLTLAIKRQKGLQFIRER